MCVKVEKYVDEWQEMLKMCITLSTVEIAQIKDFFESKCKISRKNVENCIFFFLVIHMLSTFCG